MPKRPRKIKGKKISDSQAPNKVGFDGNVSRTVRLRDIAGASKRDLRVVMRPSRWQEQYLRGFISSRQLSAVERLERDWHSSKLISYSSASAARGSSSGSRPVDSKIDAMLRKNNALHYISYNEAINIFCSMVNESLLHKLSCFTHIKHDLSMIKHDFACLYH